MPLLKITVSTEYSSKLLRFMVGVHQKVGQVAKIAADRYGYDVTDQRWTLTIGSFMLDPESEVGRYCEDGEKVELMPL